MAMLLSLMLPGCSKDETGMGDDAQVETVNVRFVFSMMPQQVQKVTRMSSDVVQQTGMDRGIDNARVLCYNSYPSASSTKIGEMIEFKNSEDELISSDTIGTEVSEFREVGIPVGTTHFGFYGTASGYSATHENRMKYGIIEVVGLSKNTYTGNSGIRFKPVQICTSEADFGGSHAGANLFTLLNELMDVTSTAPAPDDRWDTTDDRFIKETYNRLIELKTLSSQHVALMLAAVYRVVSEVDENSPARPLADAILTKIASACTTVPEETTTTADLKEEYLGFPDDIHLPVGAARITWDATAKKFVVPDKQDYGKEFNVLSMNDYCYPMNLQYQVLSDIVASDEVVVMPTSDTDTDTDTSVAEQWQEIIDNLYSGASTVVQQSTRSVAMKQQVNYAVGKLALKTRIGNDPNEVMYDAHGKVVDVSNGFTLKGYIIGGQREVDYNFQPVAGSKEYAIYDTDLNGGAQPVKRYVYTDENFVLGLGTDVDKDIQIALELVNNGNDFQGADGVIMHGATFYLVANLAPKEGQNYTQGIDQIFSRDKATTVALTIEGGYADTDGDGEPNPDLDEYGRKKPLKGLATATYGMPKLDAPYINLGLSVNLSWEDGIWFENIEF